MLKRQKVWLGGTVELMKACDTAEQGPYATIATSYLICQGLFVTLILSGLYGYSFKTFGLQI